METVVSTPSFAEVLKATDYLEKPCVIPGFLGADAQDFLTYCHDTLRIIGDGNESESKQLQVWIENQKNESFRDTVRSNPPDPNESIDGWAQRIFGSLKFGMIINDIQNYSTGLCQKMLEMVSPFFNVHGIPAGGFDMALFIGNYGFTPLGIHKDLNGGKVLTFHFGPGPKTMYLWDDETYKHLTGNRPNYQLGQSDPILEHASQIFTFEVGDFFFMPENIWHVGKSEEFSISLTFWLNHYDQETIMDNLMKYVKKKLLREPHKRLSSFKISTGVQIQPDKELFVVQTQEEYQQASFEQFFQFLYRDYQYEMLSNGGFMTPPIKKQPVKIEAANYVTGIEPFKIYYKIKDSEHITLYVRGHQLDLPNQDAFPVFIEKINSGRKYRAEELIAPLLEEWSEDVGYYVLRLIYQHQGIRIS
jgi:hypothetical protein